MGWFDEAWGAALGQPSLAEAVRARRRMDRVTRRRVMRLVDRGAAATSPEDAELAVALARDRRRRERLAGSRMQVFFAVIVLGWLALATERLVNGHLAAGAAFGVAFAGGVAALLRRRSQAGNAERAEQANKAVLERLNTPYAAASTELSDPPWGHVLAGSAALFAFYVVFFGVFSEWLDGHALTTSGVLRSGVVFGVLMTTMNLTWVRRSNRHAAGLVRDA